MIPLLIYLIGWLSTYLFIRAVSNMENPYVQDSEDIPTENEAMLLAIIWPVTWAVSFWFLFKAIFGGKKDG